MPLCSKFSINLFIFIFGAYGFLNVVGIETYHRGIWSEPKFAMGVFFLSITLLIYSLSKKFCINYKEPIVYKCDSCGEVYDEADTNDLECPSCQGKLIDLDDYY